MKAVKQIIDYLRERGVLSLEQLKELAAGGFLDYEDVFGPGGYDERPRDEDDAFEAYEAPEYEPPPVRPGAGAGRRDRDVVHKGATPDIEEIGERLEALAEGWGPAVDGLVRLAARLGACEGWHDAALAVRNAEDDDLRRAVLASIDERGPSLECLWEAISLESYRDVIDEPGAHGPAVASYRAILAAAEGAHLGRHSVLLRDERVSPVVNLKAAQRRLLRACREAFDEDPDAFTSPLRRDKGGMAYWAFVLLYSARRGGPGHRPGPTVEERWPPRDGPDEAGWLRAWAHSATMDPDRVPPFLVEHDARQADRPARLTESLRNEMSGPYASSAADLVALIDRVGYPAGGRPAPGREDDLEALRLASILDGLRARVELDQVIGIPPDPQATRLWDGFLQAWLRAYDALLSGKGDEAGLEAAARLSFGAATDLYCPRTWDHRGWS